MKNIRLETGIMLKYVIGALAGGIFGYFVLYRLIGCADGACPLTANPYISTVIGVIIGVLLAGAIGPSADVNSPQDTVQPQETIQTSVAEYRRISAEDAKARIDSGDEIIIVDVRTEAEFDAGHLPNAILIPNETIGKSMPELLPDLDAEILIYCRSGNRSAQAAKKLVAIGYTNVYDFGGIIDWPYEIVTD